MLERDIKIVFSDKSVAKHIGSTDELNQYCNSLSVFINVSYLRKTIVRILKKEFFYFSKSEHQYLLNKVIKSFDSNVTADYIVNSLIDWFNSNDVLNLDGFVMFRLKEYYKYISVLVQEAAEHLIAELEKLQIINYLKNQLYQQISYIDTVYIYSKNNSYKILNENFENLVTINNCDELLLNIIISIAPTNIYFHGKCDNCAFFETLLSIFENRIKVIN